ncbi:hypothetical protein EC973_001841 [Apophysomyces ossiformis]|uniref:F-box domain-containing protein n=1 Tax=Apophysomyces ossiformis TaxID=679940 RepID=A0A8H7EP11_9FUNG|nr:hypothetical protein EC973_001841 [Apophysomyces ossiformis]
MSFSYLPTELILMILNIFATHKEPWLLDLLSAAMVCRSWYAAAISLIKPDELFRLVNYAGAKRIYPHRRRLAGLLEESKRHDLVFHRLIHRLVIDLLSFEENNMVVAYAPSPVLRLVTSCPNIESLEIVYDAKFASMSGLIVDRLECLKNSVQYEKIRRLELVGQDPIHRCPCCAGRGWDHLLCDFLGRLAIETLTLRQVIPSQAVFKTLSQSASLHHLVLYRSILEMPRTVDRAAISSLTHIPQSFLRRIDTLEIYEDLEDCAIAWPAFRYFSELADAIGPLQTFLFECSGDLSKENPLEYVNGLLLLAERRSKSLRNMILHHVPGIDEDMISRLLEYVDHLEVDSVSYSAHVK